MCLHARGQLETRPERRQEAAQVAVDAGSALEPVCGNLKPSLTLTLVSIPPTPPPSPTQDREALEVLCGQARSSRLRSEDAAKSPVTPVWTLPLTSVNINSQRKQDSVSPSPLLSRMRKIRAGPGLRLRQGKRSRARLPGASHPQGG